jgi:hypothetical protein
LLAQVNVEPVRDRLNETGRTLELRANLTGKTGNTEQLAFGAGGLLGIRSARNLFYVTASADYSRIDHAANVAKAFGHGRYNRELLGWLWWEAFGQTETDRFRRVAVRQLLGTGPRFIAMQTPELALFYGATYMLELTERSNAVASDRRRRIAHRFNNYATLNVRPHPQISLSETLYYQPRFDSWADYWLLSVFAARFEVTQTLSTLIDFTLHRESVVPVGVERTDTSLISSITLTL